MFIDFKERGRGTEREREKHRLVTSHTCLNWGSNPKPMYVPWLGIEPATVWYVGQCSN